MLMILEQLLHKIKANRRRDDAAVTNARGDFWGFWTAQKICARSKMHHQNNYKRDLERGNFSHAPTFCAQLQLQFMTNNVDGG